MIALLEIFDCAGELDPGEHAVRLPHPVQSFVQDCQGGESLLINRSFSLKATVYNLVVIQVHLSHSCSHPKSCLPVLFLQYEPARLRHLFLVLGHVVGQILLPVVAVP